MKDIQDIIKIAKKTINHELQSVKNSVEYIDESFANAVKYILNSKGRVIITGIGKSAIIAKKITATFNSTGTQAVFMHAADAIHGDLGLIHPNDVVMCLSKSGNAPEIKVLIPFIKNFGNKIIAIVSNTNSFLAQNADFIIKATVEKEACPNNLAPTSSTTVQLVMGDALAVALLECRNFTEHDFAKYHPGGNLGKKMYLRVSDLYLQNEKPYVNENDNIYKVLMEISEKRLGCTAVLDSNSNLKGIITDGDLRRMLEKNMPLDRTRASEIMGKNPKLISPDVLAITAFEIMKKNNITQLIVSKDDTYLGIVHIHDILKEGVV